MSVAAHALRAIERVFVVDGRQVGALVRAALRLDFRAGSGRDGDAARDARSGVSRAARMLLAYVLTGSLAAYFIAAAPTFYVAALVLLASLSVVIGAVVVLDFHSIVLSPEDYKILAHQPITSRTFFCARLAHVMLYTQALGAAFAIAPAWVLATQMDGTRPVVGAATLLACASATALVTLAAILVYAAAVRLVPAHRLRAVLSYTQLALSVSVYSGFLLVRSRRTLDGLASLSPESTPAMLLLPPSWLAGVIELSAGEGGAASWLGIGLAAAAFVCLSALATRILSLEYAERLGALAEQIDDRTAPRARGRLTRLLDRLRTGENAALGLLIPRQFRHDYRFRLGILGVAPLTVLYLVVGLDGGAPRDPFVDPQVTQGAGLLYLAVLLSPALIVRSFVHSDAFAAAWVYHVTPADGRKLVLAMRSHIVVRFLLPYLAGVAAVLAYFYGSVWHAALHAAVLGLCSGLFLLLAMWVNPGYPFAAPYQRSRFRLRSLAPIALAPVAVFGLLPAVFVQGYGTPIGMAVLVVGLAVLNLSLGRVVAARIARTESGGRYVG